MRRVMTGIPWCNRHTLKLTSKLDNFITVRRKMSLQPLETDTPIIALSELRRFITECLQAVGASQEHGNALADILVAADHRRHYSHGMNRLAMYVRDLQTASCDGKIKPKIIKETSATAWVDGQNGLGVVVGNFCMNLAIKKAKEVGVGWVAARGSNHFGICAQYSLYAIKKGMLGMAFSNSLPLLAPTGSKEPALGTNPIGLGAPAKNGDSFLLDMATSAVAAGKIEIARRAGLAIPEGWAQDQTGHAITDAKAGLQKGTSLMPLGGEEEHSGYKGYGLACLVETLCGILAGAKYSTKIRQWLTTRSAADLGQSFVAIDPQYFAPDFEERMSDLLHILRNLPPIDPSKPVLVAGDPERLHMAAVDEAGGVRYVPNQLVTCETLAKKLGVTPLQPLKK